MSAATTIDIVGRVHLKVLSQNAIATYRRCPREFMYSHVLRRRPRSKTAQLRFGTHWHVAQEAYRLVVAPEPECRLEAALGTLRAKVAADGEVDEYAVVMLEELLVGYAARYYEDDLEYLAVEQDFEVPLVNPETRAVSRTYRMQGAIDAVVRRRSTGQILVLESKTTSSDITLGSDYWRRVSVLDTQCDTYLMAARALGHEVEGVVYDVVRKPALRPLRATPPESRKYTKNGLLYASQRENDETPEEYRLRVREAIQADPSKYYARGDLVRLEGEEEAAAGDLWQTASFIRESENSGRFPRSPNACSRFGSWCPYFDTCSGITSIDDDNFYQTEEPHRARAAEEIG